jgi:hypothetical protein
MAKEHRNLTRCEALPRSCAEILANNPGTASGTFTIETLSGPAEVFCEMVRAGGGWTRVVLHDYGAGVPCPAPWVDPANDGIVACRRASGATQSSTSFAAPIAYRELLGSIQGIARDNLDAFGTSGTNIDQNYVDGISVTTGAPRLHLFTLAASHNQTNNDCPRDGGPGPRAAITGGRFACDKAANQPGQGFDTANPLWDDNMRDLPPGSSDRFFTSAPLSTPVTSAIEVRILLDQAASDEEFAIKRIELYVR